MTAKEESKARGRVNSRLVEFNRAYHYGLGLDEVDTVLHSEGFNALEPAIYCGRDGQSTEQVGPRTYLHMTWHKMESGRYEVIVYLS